MDSLRWQEIGPSSPCLLLLHLQLLQEGHHVFLGNHILILLHHTVRPIASNHLNGRNWLVPTGPLLPHVPFWGSRWEELDARVPHHLKWEDFQSLFQTMIQEFVGHLILSACWHVLLQGTVYCSYPHHISPSWWYYGHMALLLQISDIMAIWHFCNESQILSQGKSHRRHQLQAAWKLVQSVCSGHTCKIHFLHVSFLSQKLQELNFNWFNVHSPTWVKFYQPCPFWATYGWLK